MNKFIENPTGKTKHSLILTSCLYPPDLLRQRIAFRMMDKISDVIDGQENTSTVNTLLFAGDIIYADASAGLLDPSDNKEKFAGAYRRLEEARAWQKLTGKIDHRIHTIDDHEIVDNWEPAVDSTFCDIDGCSEDLKKEGKKAFHEFIMDTPKHKKLKVADPRLWGRRNIDGLQLFLLDTRTERGARSASNSNSAKMISKAQKTELFKWLSELHALDLLNPDAPPIPKFIMSGSMILPRKVNAAYAAHQGAPTLQSDSWDGYPNSREKLLRYIAKNTIKNVVFLSGDEHLPIEATINLTYKNKTTTVYSLHGSPLWAPFEFANTDKSELMESDTYTFAASSGSEIKVDVKANFPDVGNGFLVINLDIETPKQLALTYTGDRNCKSRELPLCTSS